MAKVAKDQSAFIRFDFNVHLGGDAKLHVRVHATIKLGTALLEGSAFVLKGVGYARHERIAYCEDSRLY